MKLPKYIFIVLISALLILLMFTSCSKKKVRKIQPLDAKITIAALESINKIRELYQERNFDGIRGLTTSEGYDQIEGSIKDFTSAELKFTPKWVEINGDTIQVNIYWTGKWKTSADEIEENGLALFILKGAAPKVDRVLRSNPFSKPQ
ncbi:lipoprotein [Candidatus Magnetoovum chiemensis]|nr:lipoprotein [Candidatus Magnetoovum chiemensis]